MAHQQTLNSAPSEIFEALGGAPVIAPDSADDGESKDAKKQRKRVMKLQREAGLPPNAFDRVRILAELVNEGRQIIDLTDHRARYALVALGVLDAGVVVAISRLFDGIPSGVRLWFIGGIAIYTVITALSVYFALECLRPRRLYRPGRGGPRSTNPDEHGSLGLLFWETAAAYDLDMYRQAWSTVRMEQLNAEVVTLAHRQSKVIRAKYAILGRLFNALVLLVILSVVLVAVAGFYQR